MKDKALRPGETLSVVTKTQILGEGRLRGEQAVRERLPYPVRG